MKVIELTQGKVALVDDEDFEQLNRYKWCANKNFNNFYALRTVVLKGGRHKTIKMHREILGLADPKILIDHRDGNGLNNQRENLRICTNQQNRRNSRKRKRTSSQYKGVSFFKRKKKWHARIGINGKLVPLGYFVNEEDAANAYAQAAKKYFGVFACTAKTEEKETVLRQHQESIELMRARLLRPMGRKAGKG